MWIHLKASGMRRRSNRRQTSAENLKKQADDKAVGRKSEDVPGGAAVAPVRILRRRLNWPEKHRPRIGRPNRREHRLVTVLCDGSELGFAPVAFCRSGDHASVAIDKPRTDRRRMAASRDLDGGAGLDRTVTSITSEPERRCRFPTPEDETRRPRPGAYEQVLTASAAMSVSSFAQGQISDRHLHVQGRIGRKNPSGIAQEAPRTPAAREKSPPARTSCRASQCLPPCFPCCTRGRRCAIV